MPPITTGSGTEVEVYVRLLGEGTEVWRPVSATKHGDAYMLAGTVPEGERWEFLPGALVRCRLRLLLGERTAHLVACELEPTQGVEVSTRAAVDAGLAQILATVTDEPSFLMFLAALSRDSAEARESNLAGEARRYAAPPRGWENTTLDSFLESAVAWATDAAGGSTPAANPWRRAADILMAGKFYE